MNTSYSGDVLSFRPREMVDVTRTLGRDSIPWPGAKDYSGTEHDYHGYVITSMRLTAHAGTHMDSPRHRFPDGRTIDSIPPEVLVTRAVVVDCGDTARISPSILRDLDFRGRAVLFRTAASGFGREGFREDYPALTGETADALVEGGAVLVGIDYLSTDLFGSDDTHDRILGAGIPQVEDLKLDEIPRGEYILLCFPLRIGGCEASPVRAFLVRETGGCS